MIANAQHEPTGLLLAGLLALLAMACSARDHGTGPLSEPPTTSAPAVPATPTPAPAASLAPPPPSAVAYGTSFSVSAGATRAVGDDGLTLTFEAVTNDSRCPTDVTCIWAGEAVTRLRVAAPGMSAATLTLHTPGGTAPAEAAYAERFGVRLSELRPAPISTRTIAPQEYEGVFVVSKK